MVNGACIRYAFPLDRMLDGNVVFISVFEVLVKR
jgi:hypothetical protein